MAMSQIQDWQEWYGACALDRCGEEARARLVAFSRLRFRTFLTRFANRTNVREPIPAPAPRDTWHLFESHLSVASTREGKRYKDWLFDREETASAGRCDVIEAGATLIMRSVVRDFLRAECSRAETVSLQHVLAGDGRDALTLEDLLSCGADPSTETAQAEYSRLARVHAGAFFAAMERRERIAVLATELGVALSNPAVLQLAGCAKSRMSEVYRRFVGYVGQRMRILYPDDDPSDVLALTLMTFMSIREEVFLWGRVEIDCTPLFSICEGSSGRKAVRTTGRRTKQT